MRKKKIRPCRESYLNMMPVKTIKKPHGIYSNHVIIFHLLTLCGLFPLHCNEQGTLELNWKSWQAIYSVIFISIGLIFSTIGFQTVIGNYQTLEMDFENSIYYACILGYPFLHLMTVFTLLKANTIANYLNNFSKLMKCFERVTGKPSPDSKSHLLLVVILVAFLAWCWVTIFCNGFYSNLIKWKLQDFIHYAMVGIGCFGNMQILLLIGFLDIVTSSYKTMSKILLQDVLRKNSENLSLEEHVNLWLNLRQMCINFGDVFWMTYGYLVLFAVVISLPLLYLSADDLVSGKIFKFVDAWAPILFIHLFSEIAHKATHAIGKEFENDLSWAMLEGRFNDQLMNFSVIVASHPVIINLGGFIVLDRHFIVTTYSTLVTYMVIIIQFRPQG